MSEEMKVQDGQVVSMDYALHVDGEIIDQSGAGAPLEFIQGSGQIIRGLEGALYGMAVGDSKAVVVAAADGYGNFDQAAFVEVPRDQFPPTIPLKPGVELQVRDQANRVLPARIESVNESTVRLDFNHPLAGKELRFDVKIVALRDATEEEKAHGHSHSHGHE